MNESAVIGGYGQSTPRKGTPNDDEEGIEASDVSEGMNEKSDNNENILEGVPRLDLDISAIAPPPVPLMKGKNSQFYSH